MLPDPTDFTEAIFKMPQISKHFSAMLVRAGNNVIKAAFMHTKRTTFPTKMKIGIHVKELKLSKEIDTFLLLESPPIGKTNISL